MKLLLGLTLLVGIVLAAEWTYEGTAGVNYWDQRPGTSCGGTRQSPIDIPRTLTYQNYAAFTMTGYDSLSGNVDITNNGHTAQVDINTTVWGDTTLSGGGLDGTYIAIQLHFHWGKDDHEGSEHTFRGQQYPLEMHIVHYKQEYGDLTSAIAESDGIAVLGFFFTTEDAENNNNLDSLITALSSVQHKGDKQPVSLEFSDLMPTEQTHFYRYEGSLTTPECLEVVIWTVFDHVNTISPQQMAAFRSLLENEDGENDHKLEYNYRPVQSLNGRTVYKNYDTDVPSSWHWSYEGAEGADYWPNYYDTCSGNQQSPVNIPKVSTFNANIADELATLEFGNYDQDITGTIKNNGHTIQIDIDSPEIFIEHGRLNGKYIAAQFHFHWGGDNNHGSEHTYSEDSSSEKQYPLEMHIVHYKEDYGSLGGSLAYADGLAVVGFFFEVSSSFNTNYGDIIAALPDVMYKDSSKVLTGYNLRDLTHSALKIDNTTGHHIPMYRYMGGLTTPPCSEVVTWTVMQTPIPMHADQLAEFRRVTHITSGTPTSHDYITHNYRPVQNLAGRTIYSSYDYGSLSDTATCALPNIIAMFIVICLAVILK